MSNTKTINVPKFPNECHQHRARELVARLYDASSKFLNLVQEYSDVESVTIKPADDMIVMFGRPKEFYINENEGIILPIRLAESLGYVKKVRKIRRVKKFNVKETEK